MDAAGADGFAQAVVGVVLMMREIFHPAVNQAGRHWLRADVHEPPLIQKIIVQIDPPGLDCIQQILRPGHEQPYNGTFFLGHRTQNPLRLYAAQ